MVKRLKVCVGCLLQTDPQERAKTTTASSDCRPRPTALDPVVSHGNSQMQAKAGQKANARQQAQKEKLKLEEKANAKETLERDDYPAQCASRSSCNACTLVP